MVEQWNDEMMGFENGGRKYEGASNAPSEVSSTIPVF